VKQYLSEPGGVLPANPATPPGTVPNTAPTASGVVGEVGGQMGQPAARETLTK